MPTLCVAPLQQELDGLWKELVARGHTLRAVPAGCLETWVVPSLDLVLARGGHGKTQFGVQTQYLLDRLPGITRVLCVGAAGALADNLRVGDVVIARETIEHDYTQRFRRHPLPRFPADPVSLEGFQALPRERFTFQIHVGIIASGDEDVIEVERAAALRHSTEACAVAWEGAGGARAARFNELPFIELRGITDTADHQAASDFAVNLPQVMANLASVFTAWYMATRE